MTAATNNSKHGIVPAAKMNHEEAKKFLQNWLETSPRNQTAIAVTRLLKDWQKVYNVLEQLSEPLNHEGIKHLREHGSYVKYNSPVTVQAIHKLIQEL